MLFCLAGIDKSPAYAESGSSGNNALQQSISEEIAQLEATNTILPLILFT
jgi:hypothetical protein